MNVLEVIRTRRSIRKYEGKPVEREKLQNILEAARLAPSAGNKQPWDFILVTEQKVKEKLRSSYNRDWFISAPAIIVLCGHPEQAWARRKGVFQKEAYWKVDVSIAMQNLILTAWEEGLGTCWIGGFKEDKVKKALNIPNNIRVVAMTPVGYPAEEKGPVTDRRSLDDITHENYW